MLSNDAILSRALGVYVGFLVATMWLMGIAIGADHFFGWGKLIPVTIAVVIIHGVLILLFFTLVAIYIILDAFASEHDWRS